jgi:hypothetical protein
MKRNRVEYNWVKLQGWKGATLGMGTYAFEVYSL